MKYYLYRIIEDTWTVFEDYNNLLDYCSRFIREDSYHYDFIHNSRKRFSCSLFSQVNLNGNDKVYQSSFEEPFPTKSRYDIRNLMFFDGHNRIIDIRSLKEDIFNYYYDYRMCFFYRKQDKHSFRREPVAGTGSSRFRGIWRKFKLKQRLSDLNNPETKQYVRKKKYDLGLDYWEEYPYRDNSRSWKKQKLKKQYLKNMHTKGVSVMSEKSKKDVYIESNFPKKIWGYMKNINEWDLVENLNINESIKNFIFLDKDLGDVMVICEPNGDIIFRYHYFNINNFIDNNPSLSKEEIIKLKDSENEIIDLVKNSSLKSRYFLNGGFGLFFDLVVPNNVTINKKEIHNILSLVCDFVIEKNQLRFKHIKTTN